MHGPPLKKKMETDQANLRTLSEDLLRNWRDGRIKLYVTFQALNFRRKNHQLFGAGAYLLQAAEGPLTRNICTFARQEENKTVLVIVPRFLTGLIPNTDTLPLGKVWGDSRLMISEEISGHEFRNIFTGETAFPAQHEGKKTLPLQKVFADFPLALLEVS